MKKIKEKLMEIAESVALHINVFLFALLEMVMSLSVVGLGFLSTILIVFPFTLLIVLGVSVGISIIASSGFIYLGIAVIEYAIEKFGKR